MSLWHYIGEFLLFRTLYRWLFGSRNDRSHDSYLYDSHHITDDYDTCGYHHDVIGHHDAIYHHMHDDRHMIDDRDTERDCNDDSNRDRDTYYDYGDSQSYDNFLDEQDDYDMMDDL